MIIQRIIEKDTKARMRLKLVMGIILQMWKA